MKTSLSTLIKSAGTGLFITLAGVSLQAQKLSDVQASSVWAPEKVKVDGKLTEWNDSFQAFNKATLLTYTLSNDDKNLYLAIKSADAANNTKIMRGGISFIINPAGKKKDKDAYIVTFPVINRAAGRGQAGGGGFGGGRGQGGGGGQFGGGGQTMTTQQRDSMARARNTQTLAAVKEIKVIGFKDITDSLISIYNEYGVKAVASFSAAGEYQYELAIPLTSLGFSVDKPKEFAYSLKLNGIQFGGGGQEGGGRGGQGGGGGGFGGGGGGGFGGGGGGGFGGGGGGFGGGGGGAQQALLSPTDFWGKYTLAKKQ